MISSSVMSLTYKFADKMFSFIAQKQAVQVPPSEGHVLEKGCLCATNQ